MPDYKVKFEVFEGPLDLLLYLIKKEEVDIYQVNLTQIATQFIEHIEVMRMLDLEIAGEFLVMAATLMYIKSRELLPVDKQVVVTDEEQETEDPRWELIRQLVEYKKFKDAAGQLAQLENRQEGVYPRIPGIVKFEAEPEEDHRPQASIFDLVNAVNAILKRHEAPQNDEREIYAERWTVSEKIEALLQAIAEKPVIKFSELFASAQSRGEVVVTFLAMLELIRLHHLRAVQSEAFGEIEITRPPASTEQVVESATALNGLTEEPAASSRLSSTLDDGVADSATSDTDEPAATTAQQEDEDEDQEDEEEEYDDEDEEDDEDEDEDEDQEEDGEGEGEEDSEDESEVVEENENEDEDEDADEEQEELDGDAEKAEVTGAGAGDEVNGEEGSGGEAAESAGNTEEGSRQKEN